MVDSSHAENMISRPCDAPLYGVTVRLHNVHFVICSQSFEKSSDQSAFHACTEICFQKPLYDAEFLLLLAQLIKYRNLYCEYFFMLSALST